MAGSSSTSVSKIEDKRTCQCGFQASLKTTWTATNYGRRFFSCPRYKEGKSCGYFEWYDLEMCTHERRVLGRLTDRLAIGKKEVAELRFKAKIYRNALLIFWVMFILGWLLFH